MKDRSVEFPQRYRLTKVTGTDDIYDLIPAPGEITEEGTLINKGTLLSDDTAAKFFESLVGTETVDQVLGLLGNYNLHWWKRRTVQTLYRMLTSTLDYTSGGQTYNMFSAGGYYASCIIYCADNVIFDPVTGAIALESPVSYTVPYDGSSNFLNTFAGKYISNSVSGSRIWKIAEDARHNQYQEVNFYGWNYYPAYDLSAQSYQDYGAWEYLQSPNRDAYPDSGVSDGYEYQYLGKPLDNAVTASKSEILSYTGINTYGSNNPNTLTFSFVPKVILIFGGNGFAAFCNTKNGGKSFASNFGNGSAGAGCVVTFASNGSVSWYVSSAFGYETQQQCNSGGTIYTVLALG